MKKLRLVRVHSDWHATFGVLILDYPIVLTLEDPWKNNAVGESCIPIGDYKVLRCSKSPEYGFRPSQKYGDIFNIQNVPGRTLILLHRGNLPKDTEGCVLLGEEYGHLGGKPAVLGSGRAYKELMDDVLRNEPGFALSIEEAY